MSTWLLRGYHALPNDMKLTPGEVDPYKLAAILPEGPWLASWAKLDSN